MKLILKSRQGLEYGFASRVLASTLACAIFCTTTVPAFAHARHTSQSLTASSIPPHERALQALNRLTFGPRPGDVARVEAMGVDKWIEQQLHPASIDDTALEARLDSYPAMRLSEHDLLLDFPAEPLIKAVADGKMPMPSDPIEHAIYSDRVFFYQQKQTEKAASATAASAATSVPNAGTNIASGNTGSAPNSAPAAPRAYSPMAAKSFAGNSAAGAGGTRSSEPRASNGTAPSTEMMTGGVMAGAASNQDDAAGSPSMKVHEQHLYADLAATGIVNLPPAQRVAKIVSMSPADVEAFYKSLTPQEKRTLVEDLTPQQRETLLALRNPAQLVGGELVASRLLRDVYSNRQLEAVMTDFWLNHFNVYLRKGQYAPWYLVDYERNAIRPHALGKFEDLLTATAESPAMLFYLDNQQSIGPHSDAAQRAQQQQQNGQPPKPKGDGGLNENYARELMELHTLGVDGGYTQQDVTQVAEVFTGWGVVQPNQSAQIAKSGGSFGFEFNPRRHEPGTKTVLGTNIQPGGMNEGLQVLHMLAMNPATAHHVSQQLAVRFVSDKPSTALVDSMTATWMKTGGDIREVMRTMLASPEFWSKENYRAKIKTPEEFVLSAVRATGGDVIRPVSQMDALNQLGMTFFGCQTPNGYPWTSSAWVNTGDLLDRINIAISLASNKLGVATDLDGLIAETLHQPENSLPPIASKQKEEWLADALLSGPATAQTQAAILKQISETAAAAPFSAQAPARQQTVAQTQFRPAKGVLDGQKRWRADLPDSNTAILPPTDPEASTIAGLLLGSPEFQRK